MKMKEGFYFFSLVMIIVLAACQSAPTEASIPTSEPTKPLPSNTPLPTKTQSPTDTPFPTETPTPTNTPLPEGVLFRDDFSGTFQPGWEWENENPEKWRFTDKGWLEIRGERSSLLAEGFQSNLLWYPLPKGDFAVTVHLITNPYSNFHQATLYLYENSDNFVAVNRGYCDLCVKEGGAFYMEYQISGKGGAYNFPTDAQDVYLRLTSIGNNISGYYALEPDQWVRIGQFGNYFEFKKVGIGVTNVGSNDEVVGLFDYFEISQP